MTLLTSSDKKIRALKDEDSLIRRIKINPQLANVAYNKGRISALNLIYS